MVTDGNPTLNNTTTTSASEVNWEDFTQAVTSANLLKSNDSRVITVAAGAAGTISDSRPHRHQRSADQPAQRARRRLHHRDAR